uniref:Uncharacterized protein n=1 Tax=Eutreptiella gymnastica TaxID=73025 RepID=A0A7S4FQW3_9EUGL
MAGSPAGPLALPLHIFLPTRVCVQDSPLAYPPPSPPAPPPAVPPEEAQDEVSPPLLTGPATGLYSLEMPPPAGFLLQPIVRGHCMFRSIVSSKDKHGQPSDCQYAVWMIGMLAAVHSGRSSKFHTTYWNSG